MFIVTSLKLVFEKKRKNLHRIDICSNKYDQEDNAKIPQMCTE